MTNTTDMYGPNACCHLISTIDQPYSNVDVLVIGAGPTGLGAAKRLNQLVSTFSSLNATPTTDTIVEKGRPELG